MITYITQLISRLFTRNRLLLCILCREPVHPQRWQYSAIKNEVAPYHFCKSCGTELYSYATKQEALITQVTQALS